MKVAGQFLGVAASIFTIVATGLRLKWHRVQAQPGPTPVQTGSQRFFRVAAGIWLLVLILVVTIVVIVTVLPGVIELFK